jgi:hypothetical protein
MEMQRLVAVNVTPRSSPGSAVKLSPQRSKTAPRERPPTREGPQGSGPPYASRVYSVPLSPPSPARDGGDEGKSVDWSSFSGSSTPAATPRKVGVDPSPSLLQANGQASGLEGVRNERLLPQPRPQALAQGAPMLRAAPPEQRQMQLQTRPQQETPSTKPNAPFVPYLGAGLQVIHAMHAVGSGWVRGKRSS